MLFESVGISNVTVTEHALQLSNALSHVIRRFTKNMLRPGNNDMQSYIAK